MPGKRKSWALKIACICFRVQHAAPRGSADQWATASSADLLFFVCVSSALDYEFVVLCLGSWVVVLCFVSLGCKGLSR